MLGAIFAALRYEWRKSLRLSHLGWWAVLFLFPTVIILLAAYEKGLPENSYEFASVLYVILVRVSVPMGVLLWAAPSVHTELESNTWPFLALRPYGIVAMLFGKYLNAVIWSASAGLLSLFLILAITQPEDLFVLALSLVVPISLGAISFGAVYTLISTLFLKRAMVFAIGYTLVFEVAISLVPTVIKEFSIAFRLRTICAELIHPTLGDFGEGATYGRIAERLFADGLPYMQYIYVLCITVFALGMAVYVLRNRQLVLAEK